MAALAAIEDGGTLVRTTQLHGAEPHLGPAAGGARLRDGGLGVKVLGRKRLHCGAALAQCTWECGGGRRRCSATRRWPVYMDMSAWLPLERTKRGDGGEGKTSDCTTEFANLLGGAWGALEEVAAIGAEGQGSY